MLQDKSTVGRVGWWCSLERGCDKGQEGDATAEECQGHAGYTRKESPTEPGPVSTVGFLVLEGPLVPLETWHAPTGVA